MNVKEYMIVPFTCALVEVKGFLGSYSLKNCMGDLLAVLFNQHLMYASYLETCLAHPMIELADNKDATVATSTTDDSNDDVVKVF